MDIYIKPEKKVPLSCRKEILIKDICKVYTTIDAEEIKEIKLLTIDPNISKEYLITVLDIIKAIKKIYPEASVFNVGEPDTVIIHTQGKPREKSLLKTLKIIFVTLILFAGSSTAIMSFHSDSQIPDIFKTYYKIFFGEEKETPLIIDIPYSIGLAVGIIVFYNHFAGRKISDDPTPIEVELALYDADVTETLIDNLNREPDKDEE